MSKQPLERVKLAWRTSPLPAFLRWWRGELIAMLPARLRDWVCRGPDVLWLSDQDGGVVIHRARSGELVATIASGAPEEVQRAAFAKACLGIDPNDRRVLLVVPPSQALVRRLVMPIAAATDPHRVVGYEIDRQTPFKPEQVYFDVRISQDAAPAGRVAMDLFVVPKTTLEPALERCAALGGQPDAVDVQLEDRLAGVNLLPPERRPRRVDRRHRFNQALIAVCVLLVVLVLSQWLQNRRAALATMQRDVSAMHAKARESVRLRQQLRGAIAASRFLIKRKTESPTMLAVLNDVTRRLPSNAWLDQFSLDNSGALRLRGEAARAAGLVKVLGTSKLLHDPELQGVIQPDPDTGKERFALTARVHRPGAADAH